MKLVSIFYSECSISSRFISKVIKNDYIAFARVNFINNVVHLYSYRLVMWSKQMSNDV